MRPAFVPFHRACDGGRPSDATAEYAYVSHAENSTIVSNFCQARLREMQNAECKMQNEEGSRNAGIEFDLVTFDQGIPLSAVSKAGASNLCVA